MSATGRSDARQAHPRDLYQTRLEDFAPLLEAGAVRLNGQVWEPCAGRGAMVRALIGHGVDASRIIASDVTGLHDVPDAVIRAGDAGRLDLTGVAAGALIHGVERDGWLTVITNPPYRVPDASTMCGLRGELLDMMIPRAGREGRDGVAMAFAAADNAGADQIVLGPVRVGWLRGSQRRIRLRHWILVEWDISTYGLPRRPRFLDPEGRPAGSGTDSCESEYIVATRRKEPRKRGDAFGWCNFMLEIDQ